MLRVISLFTGVGGLDFGFEAAGYDTAVALDSDPVACRMVRLNRRWPILEGKIDEISSEQILKAAGLAVGEADVLIGGPPCQPFSKAGYWANGDAKRLDDPRAGTLAAYLRVLRDTRPRAFLIENVHGLVYQGKDEGLRHLKDGLEQVNQDVGTRYRIDWAKVNAASYGVPQLRERVFLIGNRDGRPFRFPPFTHGPAESSNVLAGWLEPHRCAWDAIGDLPARPNDLALTVGGKWAELLPSIPEGSNYLWHTKRGGGEALFGWRTRFWSFLLKLKKDQPSWTIQAQPGPAIGPFHWSNRKLSGKELCRLQTFPDDLDLACSRGEVQRLLGNAVPSLLAEVLAREIRRQLLDAPPATAELRLMPPRRSPIPPPERVESIATKFRQYIGDHDDHPGEGRGSRARGRVSKVKDEAGPLLV